MGDASAERTGVCVSCIIHTREMPVYIKWNAFLPIKYRLIHMCILCPITIQSQSPLLIEGARMSDNEDKLDTQTHQRITQRSLLSDHWNDALVHSDPS